MSKEELVEKMVYGIANEVNPDDKLKLVNLKLCDIQIDINDLAKCYKEKYGKELSEMASPWLKFDNCEFINCTFKNLNMNYFKFDKCDFGECNFYSCQMNRWDVVRSKWQNVNIRDCSMIQAGFYFTEIQWCDIKNSDLRHTPFLHSVVTHSLFCESDLGCTIFKHLDADGANFFDCEMRYIVIANSRFNNSICTGATKFDRTSRIERLSLTGTDYQNRPITKDHFISVNNIGSRSDNTYYDYEYDRVICGCWESGEKRYKSYIGGSLEAFEKRVKEVYPEGIYHDEYMNAIAIFKAARQLYLDKQKAE